MVVPPKVGAVLQDYSMRVEAVSGWKYFCCGWLPPHPFGKLRAGSRGDETARRLGHPLVIVLP